MLEFFVLFIALLLILCMLLVVVCAVVVACHSKRGRKGVLVCVVVLAAASWFSTYHYSPFPNSNTKVIGWPVPVVVLQRANPDAPWLDFIGLTVILALPLNFLLFATPPALGVLLWAWRVRRKKKAGAVSV